MHIMHDIGSGCSKKYFLAHCDKLSQIKSIKKPKDGASGSLFVVGPINVEGLMFEFEGSEHMTEWCGLSTKLLPP